MDLRQLECFMAVCREMHFSRAAEKLHMAQPSLSRHIRNLEATVGMPLFDRIGRSVALTEAGRILQAHAQRIFHEMEQAEAAIRDLHGLLRGKLTIGALPTVSYVLPTTIQRFKSLYPNIELSILGLRGAKVTEKLLENELDLGLVSLPVDDDDLECVPLLTEELALAVPVGHSLAQFKAVPTTTVAEALKGVQMILLPEEYALRAVIDEYCARAEVNLASTLEISALDTLIGMVADGAGATILPVAYIEYVNNPRIAAVQLLDPTPRREVGMAYRKGKFMCATTRTFIKQLTKTAASLAKTAPAPGETASTRTDPSSARADGKRSNVEPMERKKEAL